MNYTKVKPTVVKHVLPNEVMNIHDPSVSFLSFVPVILSNHTVSHFQIHKQQFYLRQAENIFARGPSHQMTMSHMTGAEFTQSTERSAQSLRYQPGQNGDPKQDARDLISELK